MYFLLLFSYLKEYQNFFWNISILLDDYAIFVLQVGNLFHRKDYKIELKHISSKVFLVKNRKNTSIDKYF